MRIYWRARWWMLPFLVIVWPIWAVTRLVIWALSAPSRRRRNVVRITVSVHEKEPAHPS